MGSVLLPDRHAMILSGLTGEGGLGFVISIEHFVYIILSSDTKYSTSFLTRGVLNDMCHVL